MALTLCLRQACAALNHLQLACGLEPGHVRRIFSWAPALSRENTGMHILLYVLCFLFLDTFDFFHLSPHILL